jgi:hypothetical protein
MKGLINMAKKLYKGGKWFNWKNGKYQESRGYGFGYKGGFNSDKNVVKIVKPESSYIPVTVHTGIYCPSTRELTGKRVEVVNVCNIQKYCESEIFGKKGTHTSIVMDDCTVYVLETWKELDALISESLVKYRGCKCQQTKKD